MGEFVRSLVTCGQRSIESPAWELATRPARRRRSVAGCIAVVLAGALAACTSGAGDEPEIGEVPVVRDTAELVLPLDAYDYTTEGYRAFVQAGHLLTRECLSRFGVIIPADGWDYKLPEFDGLNEGRYRLLDLDAAATRGYNAAPESGRQGFSSWEEMAEYRAQLDRWSPSEEELFLMRGHTYPAFAERPLPLDVNGDPLPEDGCSGEAQRTLTSGLGDKPWPSGVDSNERAINDSRVEAAMAAWSECMSARGYDYSSSSEPNNREWPEPPTDEEIATAVADIECKLETNLVGIWFAVESAYQQQFIDAHAGELAELRHWLDTVQTNAARYLAGTG